MLSRVFALCCAVAVDGFRPTPWRPAARSAVTRGLRVPVASVTASEGGDDAPVSLSYVESVAALLGCRLAISGVGPAYRIELLWDGGAAVPSPVYGGGEKPRAELLGVSSGFSQPTGVVHLEAIQIRSYSGYWYRRRRSANSGATRYSRAPRVEEGLGTLLSCAVFCWIAERDPFRCKRMQLLAIRDDERQHATLVRYYRKLGFRKLRDVDGSLRTAADYVVWGGEGALMEAEVAPVLARCSKAVRAMARRRAAAGTG